MRDASFQQIVGNFEGKLESDMNSTFRNFIETVAAYALLSFFPLVAIAAEPAWWTKQKQQGVLNPAPPQLYGQLFQLVPSPNRYNLDTFFELHVWAWKANPEGTFTDMNPDVSCDAAPSK